MTGPTMAGDYKGIVRKIEVVEHPTKGFAVIVHVDVDGLVMNKWLWFSSDKAIAFTRQVLKVCGFDIDTRTLTELETDPECTAGTEIKAVVDVDDNGRMELKYINAPSKPKSPKVLAELTTKLRAAKSKKAPQPEPVEEAPAPSGDDIPF